MDSSKIRCALSNGHPVREVGPAKRAQQKGSEVNAEVLPQVTHGSQIRRAESQWDARRMCKLRADYSQPDVTQSWGACGCGGLARAHTRDVRRVWPAHLEGRVQTVGDRAVRKSLAKAQAQGAKEDGEPYAEEAHPGVELSSEHTGQQANMVFFWDYSERVLVNVAFGTYT